MSPTSEQAWSDMNRQSLYKWKDGGRSLGVVERSQTWQQPWEDGQKCPRTSFLSFFSLFSFSGTSTGSSVYKSILPASNSAQHQYHMPHATIRNKLCSANT